MEYSEKIADISFTDTIEMTNDQHPKYHNHDLPNHDQDLFLGINSILDNYYNNPTLVKIKNIYSNENKPLYSMYGVKLYCLLNRMCRYLLVITPYDDMDTGVTSPLKNLEWVSFQTRTLEQNFSIPVHSYQPRKEPNLLIGISRNKQTDTYSQYTTDKFNLMVTLYNKDKHTDYQSKGTLLNALETFQTVITKV